MSQPAHVDPILRRPLPPPRRSVHKRGLPPRSSDVVPKSGDRSREALARERMVEGDVALARRQAEIALAEYGHALSLAEGGPRALAAEIFVRLGHTHRLLGRREARDFYAQALRLDPRQTAALRGLLEEHVADANWRAVGQLEERLFALVDDAQNRCVELIASGDRWLTAADAPVHARVRYRRALQTYPDSHAAARRLATLRTGASLA